MINQHGLATWLKCNLGHPDTTLKGLLCSYVSINNLCCGANIQIYNYCIWASLTCGQEQLFRVAMTPILDEWCHTFLLLMKLTYNTHILSWLYAIYETHLGHSGRKSQNGNTQEHILFPESCIDIVWQPSLMNKISNHYLEKAFGAPVDAVIYCTAKPNFKQKS